ncbi:putative ankyrin repeat protein RF_0381 [Zophobas morio]|uniref:putative ankyrin repeat protein RF_0381 n=1 Tax=Zophobas morio TaxID=2755281 RepID=UPI003082D4FD
MTDNDNFDVFELAKNPDGYTLFKMVLDNFEIYNQHINSEDEHGNTLLHLIVNHYDHINLVNRLLTLGADVNKSNFMDETPVYFACSKGKLKLAKLLVEKGADLRVKDSKSKSLLHIAVEKSNLELCRFLIERGLDVNSQDHDGETPLHYAVQTKHNKILFLLVHKADINKQDHDGYTPLHLAAKTSVEVVNFLLRNKASTSLKTFNGDSPLHLAAAAGNLATATVLLSFFNVNCLNNDNYSAAQLAEMNGHEEVQRLLQRHCAPPRGPEGKKGKRM